jgi:hypothetical protein
VHYVQANATGQEITKKYGRCNQETLRLVFLGSIIKINKKVDGAKVQVKVS